MCETKLSLLNQESIRYESCDQGPFCVILVARACAQQFKYIFDFMGVLQDAESFTKYIQLAPLEEFHRVIPAEDFMEQIAPEHWPQEQRIGFCWSGKRSQIGVPNDCGMKRGQSKWLCRSVIS